MIMVSIQPLLSITFQIQNEPNELLLCILVTSLLFEIFKKNIIDVVNEVLHNDKTTENTNV